MKLWNALILAGFAACLQLLVCCHSKEEPTPATQTGSEKKPASPEETQDNKRPEDQKPIGDATMDEDGTIHLTLRAESQHKGQPVVGDGKLSYRKGAPDYQMVFDHLGGLRPGESKPVPPFPDKSR
jgi:hypothetical protein